MRIIRILRKLSRAEPREWRVRSRQALFQLGNRVATSCGRSLLRPSQSLASLGISTEELGPWFRQHLCWSQEAETRRRIKTWSAQHPAESNRLVQLADWVTAGQMPIFGHLFDFTDDHRWHKDHLANVVCPDRFYTRIPYLDFATVGDSKFVWEPNRFAWSHWLGFAYYATDDEKYVQTFRSLALDWFDRNPYPQGINYSSALELAFRTYAWLWAVRVFGRYLQTDTELLQKLLSGIWLSCRHIEKHLSYYFAPNTHLLGEAFALYATGLMIPGFAESASWLTLGRQILEEEAHKQIHADGTHKELSTCYHLYTTDFYLHASYLGREADVFSDTIESAAWRLSNRLRELTPPDGVLPQLNDCDGGRLTGFCVRPLDATPSLSLANSLFAHCVETHTAGDHLWLVPKPGAERVRAAHGPGWQPSMNARDSGIVTHRNRQGDYLLFRAGPFGYLDAGHSHDGQTGFVLYLSGDPVIVDGGTGSYTQSLSIRNAFRNAQGKNVLLQDNAGPSLPAGWFDWIRKTPGRLESCQAREGAFECSGSHLGFQAGSPKPCRVHRRLLLSEQGVFVCVDKWDAPAPTMMGQRLTFHPDVSFSRGHAIRTASGIIADVRVIQIMREKDGSWNASHIVESCVRKVSYSESYGRLSETNALFHRFRPSDNSLVVTVVSRIGAVEYDPNTPNTFRVGSEISLTIGTDGRISIRCGLSPSRQAHETNSPTGSP